MRRAIKICLILFAVGVALTPLPRGAVERAYARGRRETMTVAGQTQITYGYDNADRLTSITQGSSSVGFTYDSAD